MQHFEWRQAVCMYVDMVHSYNIYKAFLGITNERSISIVVMRPCPAAHIIPIMQRGQPIV